ncbi:hypothetical protein, partial [Roseovarius sp. D0-M9]|uniref:hypothetical protein n=1 Tax=Roseovarius sp. D0-M9 TaxID=3127117 RepID=UPI0030100947
RSAQAPARVTLRHNIWCGRELTGDPHTHTNREEAKFQENASSSRTLANLFFDKQANNKPD